MTQISDEINLDNFKNSVLTLTTHRVVKIEHPYRQSVMLEQISSCQIIKKSTPIYLIIAFLSIVVCWSLGVLQKEKGGDGAGIAVFGFVIAVFFIILYLLSRKTIVSISSSSIDISVETNGKNRADAITFIEKVEKAINDRILYINRID